MVRISKEAKHYINFRSELVNNRAMTFIGAQITSGKTLGAKMYLLDRYLSEEKKSFFLCRTQDEKKALIMGFNDEILDKAPMNGYDFPDDLELDNSKENMTVNGETWCIVATMREADKYGRNAWPGFDLVYIDEFIMDVKWKYVPNEFEQVMKFCKNVFRTRPNCRLIASGNSHDFDNPYFANLATGCFDTANRKFKLKNIAQMIDVNKRNNLFKFIDIVRPGEKGIIKHEKGVSEWYWSYPVLGDLKDYTLQQIESVISVCAPSYAAKAIQNKFIGYDVDNLVKLSNRAYQVMRLRVGEDKFYIFEDGENLVVSNRGNDSHPGKYSAYSDDLKDKEMFLSTLTKFKIQQKMEKDEVRFTESYSRSRFNSYFGKKAV